MANIKWDKKNEVSERTKDKVINTMNNSCKMKIEAGFEFKIKGKTYRFSYEQENQINFQNTYRLFELGIIKETKWNAYLGEDKIRILLDKKTFSEVFLAGIMHKQSILSKYNDIILPSIDTMTNVEELKTLKWEDYK
jgi:hypothetical protein